MSEAGSEVKVHRMLLGLYTEQWRHNLQGLPSTELVFILQGVGHQELEELRIDIYRPLFDSREVEDTETDIDGGTEKNQEEDEEEKGRTDDYGQLLDSGKDENEADGEKDEESDEGGDDRESKLETGNDNTEEVIVVSEDDAEVEGRDETSLLPMQ